MTTSAESIHLLVAGGIGILVGLIFALLVFAVVFYAQHTLHKRSMNILLGEMAATAVLRMSLLGPLNITDRSNT